MNWLVSNLATIIILALVLLAAGFAARAIYKRKGGCSCGCSGGCSGCHGCGDTQISRAERDRRAVRNEGMNE